MDRDGETAPAPEWSRCRGEPRPLSPPKDAKSLALALASTADITNASDGDAIDPALLPPHIAAGAVPAAAPAAPPGRLEEMEREAVRAAIAGANGNLSRAARTLGIARSTLYVKLASMKIEVPAAASRQ